MNRGTRQLTFEDVLPIVPTVTALKTVLAHTREAPSTLRK